MKDALIDHRLNLDENAEHFFTFLTDRFEALTGRWQSALERRFKRPFSPIWVSSTRQNELFPRENYLILNKRTEKATHSVRIHVEDYEDLNRWFSESSFVKSLIETLIKRQGRVFIADFTSSFLDLPQGAIILGPPPRLVTCLDNKADQVRLFSKLDLPRNDAKVCARASEAYGFARPFFISAAYTSGGQESKAIYTETDLDDFFAHLRSLNKKGPFVIAKVIDRVSISPNVSAIVTEEGTRVLCITDQILRDVKYLGNIYPSKATEEIRFRIVDATKKVGEYLSLQGFRGLFGMDFIVDDEERLYTVDLNPRRQGGYLCNAFTCGGDLIATELALALGEPVEFNPTTPTYAWAHSKIKPYFHNTRILEPFVEGSPHLPFEKVGASYAALFHMKDTILVDGNAGYFIASGHTREEVLSRTIRRVEEILSTQFDTYQGSTPRDY